MPILNTPEACSQARTFNALTIAATLLAVAAVSLAAVAGFNRGADIPQSIAWSAIGIAASLAAIEGPRTIINAWQTGERARALTILPAYLLAAAMAVTVALGSASSGRTLATDNADALSSTKSRLAESYSRSKTELETIQLTRNEIELDAERQRLDGIIRGNDCSKQLPSNAMRQACNDRSAIEAERGRNHRRSALIGAMNDATAKLDSLKPMATGNADAKIIAEYLAAIGLRANADSVAKALMLIAVAFVELGGGLLLAASDGCRHRQQVRPVTSDVPSVPADVPNVIASVPTSQPQPSIQAVPAVPNARNEAIIERLLQGAIVGSQRAIAEQVGTPLTTLRNIVENDPRIRLVPSRHGSRLELALPN